MARWLIDGGLHDLRAMQDAVRRGWTPRSRWHVGDLAWRRYAVPDREAAWRAALWRDGDGGGDTDPVRAWGWAELPGDLALHVDPAHPARAELAGEVLSWFDGLATGPDRAVTVSNAEWHLRDALHRAGYRVDAGAPFFLHCVLDLGGTLAAPTLPHGYRVRAVREGEVEARAAVHRAAWRPARIGTLHVPPADFSDLQPPETASSFRAVMNAWPYRHDFDQVVEAPDGTLVASALGWLDGANQAGMLEPVGTDPRHARLGLGRAVTGLPACPARRRGDPGGGLPPRRRRLPGAAGPLPGARVPPGRPHAHPDPSHRMSRSRATDPRVSRM